MFALSVSLCVGKNTLGSVLGAQRTPAAAFSLSRRGVCVCAARAGALVVGSSSLFFSCCVVFLVLFGGGGEGGEDARMKGGEKTARAGEKNRANTKKTTTKTNTHGKGNERTKRN